MTLRTTLALSLLAVACSGTQVPRATYRYAAHDPATLTDVDIRPGAMPDNESFEGSYSSQQIGDVFLTQTGDSVVGRYAYNRGNCRPRGRLEGSVQGNLLRFTWIESQASCGRMGELRGRGWFLFWKDSAGNGRLSGEWGQGEAETGGGPWTAFRDRVRRQPSESDFPAGGAGDGVFNDSPATSPSGRPSTPAR